MAHFIIHLQQDVVAEVSWGKVRKIALQTILHFLFKKETDTDEKKGYIIKLLSGGQQSKEYRLLKAKNGKWLINDDEGFIVTPDDEISIILKKEIDRYEIKQLSL